MLYPEVFIRAEHSNSSSYRHGRIRRHEWRQSDDIRQRDSISGMKNGDMAKSWKTGGGGGKICAENRQSAEISICGAAIKKENIERRGTHG